jgi:ATP-dependent Clp protease protease subunit
VSKRIEGVFFCYIQLYIFSLYTMSLRTLSLLAAAAVAAIAVQSQAQSQDHVDEQSVAEPVLNTIRLTEDNFITFRGPVTGSSASTFINALSAKRNQTELFVYLATPGGSVTAGMQMVQSLKALHAGGTQVTCISDVACSMGFVITQYCPRRVVLESSILMQHQMSLGLGGPLANIKTYLDAIDRFGKRIDSHQAARIGLTLKEFQAQTHDDWWLFGEESVEQGVADEVAAVYCDFYSEKLDKVTVNTMFGPVHLSFSKCPVARDPISISMSVGDVEVEVSEETVGISRANLIKHMREYYYGEAVSAMLWGSESEFEF